jgi:hypothetical protein
MTLWELIDEYEPSRSTDERASIPIHSELRLRSELRRLAGMKPRLVQLVSSEGEMLALALCGAVAMAYWSEGPCVLRNRVVRALDLVADDPSGLLYRGHQLILEAEAVFPLEDVIELAAFVYNYQQLPIWVGACAEAEMPSVFAEAKPVKPSMPRKPILEGICVRAAPASFAG